MINNNDFLSTHLFEDCNKLEIYPNNDDTFHLFSFCTKMYLFSSKFSFYYYFAKCSNSQLQQQ